MTLPTADAVPLDQVYTRYAYHKIGDSSYKDNKYNKRTLLKLLDERALTAPGGGQTIVHPVNLGTSANGGSLARNQSFSFSGNANETWARYSWKVLYETCFVSWWDTREAGGNQFKMKSILDSRMDETRENLEDTALSQMCASSAATSNDITPLLTYVATTGAAGGLNPATAGQTTWAAQNEDTINWSVEGIGRARQGWRAVNDRKGNIDVWLLPGTYWEETCEIGDAALVINQDAKTRGGTKYADLGMQVPFILGKPVIHDPAWDTAQSATGLGLDLSGIHLVTDSQWDYYMWPFKEMVHNGILGQASVQIRVCELTLSARRWQLSLTTIT